MPPVATAAILLGAGLLAQSDPSSVNVACNNAFSPTRPPLSTALPAGVGVFDRCIEIDGWGDSARFVADGGGGGLGSVVLDAFSVTLQDEVPEVMLLRQWQLSGQVIVAPIFLWQVRLETPAGAVGGVELAEVVVQSVTTSITVDGYATRILLQPRGAIWRAWRANAPGPGGAPSIEFNRNFANP
jgi:hypothetical protein